MRVGDVVLSFDGEKVRSARHLARLIEETPDGRDVAVEIRRDGATQTLKVRPRAVQSIIGNSLDRLYQFEFPESFERFRDRDGLLFSQQVLRRGRLGVDVQELTDQLGEYFGATTGVLVTRVHDGSAAKTAGLKAGDVITEINGQAVRTTADIQRRLLNADGKASVTIIRDRKPMTIDVPLTDQPGTVRRGIAK